MDILSEEIYNYEKYFSKLLKHDVFIDIYDFCPSGQLIELTAYYKSVFDHDPVIFTISIEIDENTDVKTAMQELEKKLFNEKVEYI